MSFYKYHNEAIQDTSTNKYTTRPVHSRSAAPQRFNSARKNGASSFFDGFTRTATATRHQLQSQSRCRLLHPGRQPTPVRKRRQEKKRTDTIFLSIVLRGRPRRRGTKSSPNRDAVCSTQAANLRLSESEGKRKKEMTPFFSPAGETERGDQRHPCGYCTNISYAFARK